MTILRPLAVAALGAIALAACAGDDRDPSADAPGGDAARTVEIDMVDIAFEPDALEVVAGETVRFVFTNGGDVAHDAFIGDAGAQAGHEAEMGDDDGHGGGHDDGDDRDAVLVEPGATGELVHTFTGPGTVEIGCHQPGHYEAGMRVDVTVA